MDSPPQKETPQEIDSTNLKTAAQLLADNFRALGQKEIIDEIANTQESAYFIRFS